MILQEISIGIHRLLQRTCLPQCGEASVVKGTENKQEKRIDLLLLSWDIPLLLSLNFEGPNHPQSSVPIVMALFPGFLLNRQSMVLRQTSTGYS